MTTLRLPALIGSNPLGALAAFGLLRMVAAVDPDARLSFALRDDWLAELHSARFGVLEDLYRWLQRQIAEDSGSQVHWTDDVRMPPAEFRAHLQQAVDAPERLRFLSALAADGVVDQQKGFVKPSAFYMVSGQQSLLGGLREILAALKRAKDDRLWREALAGPWRYLTAAHSLGWDPAGERLHALRHKAPTIEKATCIAGALWLALQALPMLPSFAQKGREATTGFARGPRVRAFHWPVFTTPIDVETLALLLAGGHTTPNGQARTGIAARYASERSEFGQGYAVFRPARRLPDAPPREGPPDPETRAEW